jgi:hypothetical protein
MRRSFPWVVELQEESQFGWTTVLLLPLLGKRLPEASVPLRRGVEGFRRQCADTIFWASCIIFLCSGQFCATSRMAARVSRVETTELSMGATSAGAVEHVTPAPEDTSKM